MVNQSEIPCETGTTDIRQQKWRRRECLAAIFRPTTSSKQRYGNYQCYYRYMADRHLEICLEADVVIHQQHNKQTCQIENRVTESFTCQLITIIGIHLHNVVQEYCVQNQCT